MRPAEMDIRDRFPENPRTESRPRSATYICSVPVAQGSRQGTGQKRAGSHDKGLTKYVKDSSISTEL